MISHLEAEAKPIILNRDELPGGSTWKIGIPPGQVPFLLSPNGRGLKNEGYSLPRKEKTA